MMDEVTAAEILEEYEQDRLSFSETLHALLDLAVSGDVEAHLRSYPLQWRKEIELYIFDAYDNDVGVDEFFWIGPGDPGQVERTRRATVLRTWIAKKRVSPAFARGEMIGR